MDSNYAIWQGGGGWVVLRDRFRGGACVVSGWVHFVFWMTQKSVSLSSSSEAEYVAMADGSKEAI